MSIVSVVEILRHTEKLKEDLLKAQQLVADYIIELKRDGAYIKSKDGTVTIVPYAEINDWFQTVRDKVIVIYSYLTSSDIDAIETELGGDPSTYRIRYFKLHLTRNTYIIYGGMLPKVGILEDYTIFLCFGYVRSLYNLADDLSHTHIFVSYASIIDMYGATIGTLFVGFCEELYIIECTLGYIYAYVAEVCDMDGVSTVGTLGSRSWIVSHAMDYFFNNVFRISVLMVNEVTATIGDTGAYESTLFIYPAERCSMWNTADVFRCDETGIMCVRATDTTAEPVTATSFRVLGSANTKVRLRKTAHFYCFPPEG
jgi:hypothetical protein